jgi:tRNA (guanosine-2'-O-)-methyltransferase
MSTTWRDAEGFVFGDQGFTPAEVIHVLQPFLSEERWDRLQVVVENRSTQLVPVLENIYDRGNVSAVMRSAEAFGFYRFHVVDSPEAQFKAANRVTQGTDKWLHINRSLSIENCIGRLKQQGYKVYATHLEASVSLQEIDFTQPTAVVFGNEKDGVSQECLDLVDGRFIIPMQGFAQSFNISVAAALTFYHVHLWHQQHSARCPKLPLADAELLMANYLLRSIRYPEALLLNSRRSS